MIEVPVRVKDALRDGRRLKNYRFNVLNDDGTVDFTIENSNLVSESVKIDERMCTGNQLKFGLCEGSSLEFQYFDYPNITGRQIQAFIDVQYEDANGDLQWHSIPMGFFTVDQCPMQFSTGIRKVTAYNKLKSAYLDQKANTVIQEQFPNENSVIVANVLGVLLDGYSIEGSYETIEHFYSGQSPWYSDTTTIHFTDIYGWQGPLGSGGNQYYTSGPLYVHYETCVYFGGGYSGNYPIQIKPPTYFDSLDDEIYELIKGALDLLIIQESSDDLMNGIVNLKRNNVSVLFPFHILVQFRDNTEKIYGNTLYKKGLADGNFSHLRNMTFTNVQQVTFFYPLEVSTSLNQLRSYPLYGDDAEYTYYIDAQTTGTHIYPAPKHPDGSIIHPNDILAEVHAYEVLNMPDIDFIELSVNDLPDVTLRELQSAVFETVSQYGQLDRSTDLFRGVELNNTKLLPADTLYPADNLYPLGDSIRANKSMYQKLWTDSQGVQSFRYLIITYKGLDENNKEVEKVLQRTVNADGTTDYNMSDNWLFKNLVWSDADVGDYADAMVLKMQDISWFPFEMWCAGLPYLETGDELEITNSEGTYTSYVLQRQLNGIQNLQDTFIDGELDIF